MQIDKNNEYRISQIPDADHSTKKYDYLYNPSPQQRATHYPPRYEVIPAESGDEDNNMPQDTSYTSSAAGNTHMTRRPLAAKDPRQPRESIRGTKKYPMQGKYVSPFIREAERRARERARHYNRQQQQKSLHRHSEWNSDTTTAGYFDPTLKKKELFKLEPRRPPLQRVVRNDGTEDRPPTAPPRMQHSRSQTDSEAAPIGSEALRVLQGGEGNPTQREGSPVSRVSRNGMTYRTNGTSPAAATRRHASSKAAVPSHYTTHRAAHPVSDVRAHIYDPYSKPALLIGDGYSSSGSSGKRNRHNGPRVSNRTESISPIRQTEERPLRLVPTTEREHVTRSTSPIDSTVVNDILKEDELYGPEGNPHSYTVQIPPYKPGFVPRDEDYYANLLRDKLRSILADSDDDDVLQPHAAGMKQRQKSKQRVAEKPQSEAQHLMDSMATIMNAVGQIVSKSATAKSAFPKKRKKLDVATMNNMANIQHHSGNLMVPVERSLIAPTACSSMHGPEEENFVMDLAGNIRKLQKGSKNNDKKGQRLQNRSTAPAASGSTESSHRSVPASKSAVLDMIMGKLQAIEQNEKEIQNMLALQSQPQKQIDERRSSINSLAVPIEQNNPTVSCMDTILPSSTNNDTGDKEDIGTAAASAATEAAAEIEEIEQEVQKERQSEDRTSRVTAAFPTAFLDRATLPELDTDQALIDTDIDGAPDDTLLAKTAADSLALVRGEIVQNPVVAPSENLLRLHDVGMQPKTSQNHHNNTKSRAADNVIQGYQQNFPQLPSLSDHELGEIMKYKKALGRCREMKDAAFRGRGLSMAAVADKLTDQIMETITAGVAEELEASITEYSEHFIDKI